jgi:hypothetical protein
MELCHGGPTWSAPRHLGVVAGWPDMERAGPVGSNRGWAGGAHSRKQRLGDGGPGAGEAVAAVAGSSGGLWWWAGVVGCGGRLRRWLWWWAGGGGLRWASAVGTGVGGGGGCGGDRWRRGVVCEHGAVCACVARRAQLCR